MTEKTKTQPVVSREHCHYCHGEYKVRELWEGRTRHLFCSTCYAWYYRHSKLVGKRLPAWSKLSHPPTMYQRYSMVLELGEGVEYVPGERYTSYAGDPASKAVAAALTVS